jgi:phosphatidate cytidylyltransferase
MAKARGYKPHAIISIIACFGLCAGIAFRKPHIGMGILTLGILAASGLELRRNDPKGAMENIGSDLFGMMYVGVLLSHAIWLRSFKENNKLGILLILVAIGGSMLCDSGAYFVGRAYGKKKLSPAISPGKTVEGLIGGIVSAVLAVCVFKFIGGFFMDTGLSWGEAALLGLAIALADVVGDLVESMLKRDAGVKDSGKIIPGHGGILDRLDALLWTIPVTYYFAIWAVK